MARHLVLWQLLVLQFMGCTHVTTIPIATTSLPPTDKSPAKVALVLEKQFSEFKYQLKQMGDTFEYPLGEAFQNYARNVTGSRFAQVSIFPVAPESAEGIDGILFPKVVKVEESRGLFTWTERRVVAVVEWTLKDRYNQKIIWLNTFDAEAGRVPGPAWHVKENEGRLFQDLFDQLSLKTQKAFVESKEFELLGGTP